MRVYISVDIEGVAGISHWDEARKTHSDYGQFRNQMVAEARAACEGALAAGATSITVKDAHASGRNLIASALPKPTELISGWSGHPYLMVQEIDETYDAAVFIGYHARAGAGGNPLAHTISNRVIHEIRLNGTPVSEYHLHSYAAAMVDVPVVFVSGDRNLCEDIKSWQPATRTFTTKWGEGSSQHTIHPELAIDGIRSGVQTALESDIRSARLKLPDQFSLLITYRQPQVAYEKSFYPGAEQIDACTLRLNTDDYFEVLRSLMFIVLGG